MKKINLNRVLSKGLPYDAFEDSAIFLNRRWRYWDLLGIPPSGNKNYMVPDYFPTFFLVWNHMVGIKMFST